MKYLIAIFTYFVAILALRPMLIDKGFFQFGIFYWIVMVGVAMVYFFILTSIGWLLMKKPINLSQDDFEAGFQYALYGTVLIFIVTLIVFSLLEQPLSSLLNF